VPKNLVAKIPDNVSDEEATFTVIGSIGLQGIRLANPQLGETVVVVGLGLIGLVTAELLKANGCKVVGIEFDEQKNEIARQKGVITINPAKGQDAVQSVLNETGQIGADAVVITASTKEDSVIHQAAEMSRKRGRIVLVGVIGLNIQRADFYKKELSFQVSCSYGAGRYDENYESKGHDYPLPYVRWTENRNFQTILQAISAGSLNVKPLISEIVELESYSAIYGDMRKAGVIASILRFPADARQESVVALPTKKFEKNTGKMGIIGAGNFTSAMIIPSLKKAKAGIKYIASAQGLSAKILAKKADAEKATSDYKMILSDPEVNTVLITTRHNLHAAMVVEALHAGKNVIVEKPLCLNEAELENIIQTYQNAPQGTTLTVGFNRRFSPFAQKLKQHAGRGAKNIIATMNAGFAPSEAWIQDLEIGGGRIIGEACHFIDLCSYIADSQVSAVCMNALGANPQENTDNASILLKYENGSNAVIHYFANGSKAYQKERIEVFSQGQTLILDNWRKLKAYGVKGFSGMQSRMDKGHKNQFRLLTERAQQGGEPLIAFDSIVNTTKASLACIESMKFRKWIEINIK
jgi:predicted dehydrogenase/precorrin-6B methylase 2